MLKAVAEYKWVKLQDGIPLTAVEVYDGCFITAVKGSYFDCILIPAFILNLGLIVVGPVSQEILVPITISHNYTSSVAANTQFNSPYFIDDRTPIMSQPMPPALNGLTFESYLVPQSFSAVATNMTLSIPYTCPSGADHCIYKNVSFISTSLECSPTTAQEPIVNQSDYKELTTPERYFSVFNNSNWVKLPMFFFAGEMLNRTYSDLKNYTPPLIPGFGRTPKAYIFSDYDPQYRPYVGNQTFVAAYSNVRYTTSSENDTLKISFSKCTFRSNLNTTDWITKNGTLFKYGYERSIPITLDFDKVLGNNTAIYETSTNTDYISQKNAVMINAYIMQQTILNELILPKYRPLIAHLKTWRAPYPAVEGLFQFLKEGIHRFDMDFATIPYVSEHYSRYKTEGLVTTTDRPIYSVKEANSHTLFALLFLPFIWWLTVWILSIKKTNGIMRGSSQIALMTMGLTPLASKTLGGFPNMNSGTVLEKAKKIRVKAEHFVDGQSRRVVVGLEDENEEQALKKNLFKN
ncbi:hypothetical protein G6F29_006621 [Rhizopus arrhizus]|nr:hypothetical protein G6F20_005899 [Rhizopus arrhizus]KAG0833698.1 hypothetical protein G6F19_005556 [Rhizopus arrhizus]KAG0868531.1 hypothetical protein G6F16_007961 [Rhizopus arrhizus]KAG0882459.1 hypothetical protein G6F15_006823 [Rhizopus arrhizus]KAG0895775.1 hypothetical protein G6F34_007939 [Rhizopus arrhizus]